VLAPLLSVNAATVDAHEKKHRRRAWFEREPVTAVVVATQARSRLPWRPAIGPKGILAGLPVKPKTRYRMDTPPATDP